MIGVDPGGRTTGVVVREGDSLIYWALVHRDSDLDLYIDEVVETVRTALVYDTEPVAVEDITDPNPHMGMMAVRGIIDTAQVLGAVCSHFDVVRVPPGGHGSGPLAAYPAELVGGRERKGTGKRRHVRAAYDIARAGALLASLADGART